MKKVMYLVILSIIISVGFSGCIDFDSTPPGPEVRSYFEDEYDADENTVLSVSTLNGAITITSWDGVTIALNATKRTKHGEDDLNKAEIVVSENGEQISIEIQHDLPIRSRAVDLDIKIPNTVIVDTVSSTNGPIQITDATGDIVLTNTNGPITVEDAEGYIRATTTNGGIEIKGTTGIGDLASTNGGITAEVLDIKEDIDIENNNGGVTLFINPLINASIQISTTNGGITVDDDFIIETESTYNSFSGILGSGGFSINIITVNGGIKIEELEV